MPFLYNKQTFKKIRQKLRNDMPKPEQILWYYLRGKNFKGYKFRRQYGIGNYVLDFYCTKLRLAIEIDGDSHFENDQARFQDLERGVYLDSQNIRVLRFTNKEISNNIDGVIIKPSEYINNLPPLTPPILGGE